MDSRAWPKKHAYRFIWPNVSPSVKACISNVSTQITASHSKTKLQTSLQYIVQIGVGEDKCPRVIHMPLPLPLKEIEVIKEESQWWGRVGSLQAMPIVFSFLGLVLLRDLWQLYLAVYTLLQSRRYQNHRRLIVKLPKILDKAPGRPTYLKNTVTCSQIHWLSALTFYPPFGLFSFGMWCQLQIRAPTPTQLVLSLKCLVS